MFINNIDNTYYVWGCGDYNVSESVMRTNRVIYKKCESELELFQLFLAHWSMPSNYTDKITGWNVRFFDIPYIINRSITFLGEKKKRLL